MRFARLEEAIEIVRGTGYGLTSGLESLDEREIDLWQRTINAGNLYVNRSTTGAIVLRQPFGGVGLSAYGPGVKAGGPHYVLALSAITDTDDAPEHELEVGGLRDPGVGERLIEWLGAELPGALSLQDRAFVTRAVASQMAACRSEFEAAHDCVRILGQDNLRRYKSIRGLCLRVESGDHSAAVATALCAAVLAGSQTTISIAPRVAAGTRKAIESLADQLPRLLDPQVEAQSELIARVRDGQVSRLRLLGGKAATTALRRACGAAFTTIVAEPVVREGHIECVRYLDEQSLSHDYHRYGNLGRFDGVGPL
jgi:RHH-type proline utilization regulon transcriptional repressor/proline dehydrogenase/delta 1-pyrroline-5-carboxylate dehydrogenase